LLKHHPLSKPIIAAVNGDCVAGGLELLLSTDIRATVPHARFGLPEVHWSIYPFGGATVKLIHQIGYVHAMELFVTSHVLWQNFSRISWQCRYVFPCGEAPRLRTLSRIMGQ